MTKAALALALGLLLAAGCTGRTGHPAATVTSPSPSSRAGHRAGTQPGSTSRSLPSIDLIADLTERPARWDFVALVRFGPERGQLRYIPAAEHPTTEPNSFAVAPDGSFWILDPGKHRLVHFARDGTFLEGRGGYSAYSSDLVFVRDDLVVARQYQFGAVDLYQPSGLLIPSVLNEGGLRGAITDMVPTPEGWLWADVDALPGERGVTGFFRVDLSRAGRLLPVPGLPLGNSWVTIDVSRTEESVIEVGYSTQEQTVSQSYAVHILDQGGVELAGLVAPGNWVISGEDLYMYLRVAATRPDGTNVGARYLLRVGRSPMVWERLVEPSGIDDDVQRRWLTLGPDGHLYMMVTDRDGVRIYERPS